MDWKHQLGKDELILDEILARVEQHKAYRHAEDSEYAKLWCALLGINSAIKANLGKMNPLEDKAMKISSGLIKAKRPERIIVKREPVLASRSIDYRYGFGSWLLGIVLIFFASMILANISWVEGATMLSFGVASFIALSFLAIAGFIIVRSASQMI